MTILKKSTYSVILIMLFMFLLLGFTSKGELLSFINQSFLAGLLFLMIAASIFVVRGGFFSVFSRTFKKFNKLPGKSLEEDEPEPLSKEERNRLYQNIQFIFMNVGILLILMSVLFLFFW